MIFKSRSLTANNLDPEPWLNTAGERDSAPEGVAPGKPNQWGWVFDPRPEFEPTRDPEPWECDQHPGQRYSDANVREVSPTASCDHWAPRREQFDTPVNRILVTFRESIRRGEPVEYLLVAADLGAWLNMLARWHRWPNPGGFTPAEIDHAHRVLNRLANWKED